MRAISKDVCHQNQKLEAVVEQERERDESYVLNIHDPLCRSAPTNANSGLQSWDLLGEGLTMQMLLWHLHFISSPLPIMSRHSRGVELSQIDISMSEI